MKKEKKIENPDYTKFEYVLNGKEGIEEIQKRKYAILFEGNKDCGGIYIIRNIANEKFYIGSSVGIRRRWRIHLKDLIKGRHDNSKLQFSWNKHMPDDYLFYVIEYIDKRNFDNEKSFKKELRKREQYFLNLYFPFKERGYNIKRKSTGGMNSATFEDLKQGKLIINEEEFNKIMYMMCETDATLGEIAKEIGVERHYIINIYLRNSLSNLTKNYIFREKVKTILPWIRENKMEEIKQLREKGYGASRIAKELNLPLNAICTLVKDGTLEHINTKKVYKFNLDGTFEGEFNSITEAWKSTLNSEYPINGGEGIRLCIKGARFQAGHKFWSESINFTVPLYQKVCLCESANEEPIIAYDINDIPIAGFKSFIDASRKLFNSSGVYTEVSKVCNGEKESYRNYKFKFAKEVPEKDLLYLLNKKENSPQKEG